MRYRHLVIGLAISSFIGILGFGNPVEDIEDLPPDNPLPIEAIFDTKVSPIRIKIESTHTYVLVAKVSLNISDLILEDGALVGTYQIRVPLKPDKNEWGILRLPLEKSKIVEHYMEQGGILKGTGESAKSNQPTRIIACEIKPANKGAKYGDLALEIDTGERILNFISGYKIQRISDRLASLP